MVDHVPSPASRTDYVGAEERLINLVGTEAESTCELIDCAAERLVVIGGVLVRYGERKGESQFAHRRFWRPEREFGVTSIWTIFDPVSRFTDDAAPTDP